MIPKQKVVNFVDKHREKMVDLELSFFEMTAAMAFDYFAQSDVEVAVIETGLGGRLDATNIVVPILSIITNIGLEHTALLGDTLQKIAAEKAGIVKKSIPVLIGEADERYDGVIEQAAAANKSKVIYAEREFRCESCTERGRPAVVQPAPHARRPDFRRGTGPAGHLPEPQRRDGLGRHRLPARRDAADDLAPRLPRGNARRRGPTRRCTAAGRRSAMRPSRYATRDTTPTASPMWPGN